MTCPRVLRPGSASEESHLTHGAAASERHTVNIKKGTPGTSATVAKPEFSALSGGLVVRGIRQEDFKDP